MTVNKSLFLLIIFTFFSATSVYSSYTLEITDRKTDSPLEGIDILFLPSINIAKTDEKGIVVIPDTEVSDNYVRIAIISPNIDYHETNVELIANDLTRYKIEFKKKRKIKSFRDISLKSKTLTTSQKFITKEDLNQNLQMNFNDAVKTLQTQPGVSSSGGSMDSSLFIQGGGNDEWVGIYDDVYILSPSRWGGSVSMFNPLVIENINFYTGGYPAYYANGLSGALDVAIISANAKKWNFFGALDNGIEAMAHGPIGKHVGVVLQIRRTWIDLFQTLFPDSTFFVDSGGDGITQAPYILDGVAKIQIKLSPSTRITALFYGSLEGIDLDLNKVSTRVADPNQNGNETRFSYEESNYIGSFKLIHEFSKSDILKITAGYNPKHLHYKQNDNGFREINNTVKTHPYQISLNYTHGSIDKHNIRLNGLAYFYVGDIHFDEKRYFINSQRIHTVEDRTGDRAIKNIFKREVYNLSVSDDWSLTKFLIMQYGINMNFRSVTDEFFIGPRLGFELIASRQLAIHIRTGLFNFHDFDQFKIYLNPDFKSQKSYHLVAGTKFKVGRIRFLGEAFYKNYWDLLERKPDGGYENTGIRQVGGFAINLQLTKKPKDFLNGYISYTFQKGMETITSRTTATTDGFESARIRELPNVNDSFTPSYLREHTLALFLKVTPFKKIKTKSSQKKFGWVRNQYFAMEFAFLSEKPETSVTSVVKTTNVQGDTKFLLTKDSFHNTQTPPIIKLNLKYGIPVSKHVDLFINFINVLNYQNVLYYEYTVESDFISGDDPLGTYGIDKIKTVPNIDTRFTVRGGINIRY